MKVFVYKHFILLGVCQLFTLYHTCIKHLVYTSQEYSFSLQISAMAGIVVWILLLATICIILVDTEQPVNVPSTTELSEAPPENKQGWLHPVIFEPQNKIQLTRSSYQVTTFLDFAPFMNGFLTVQAYIKNLRRTLRILIILTKYNTKAQILDLLLCLMSKTMTLF